VSSKSSFRVWWAWGGWTLIKMIWSPWLMRLSTAHRRANLLVGEKSMATPIVRVFAIVNRCCQKLRVEFSLYSWCLCLCCCVEGFSFTPVVLKSSNTQNVRESPRIRWSVLCSLKISVGWNLWQRKMVWNMA